MAEAAGCPEDGCGSGEQRVDPRVVRLPAEEFSYIGRPAETFEGRWAAIESALSGRFGASAFTLLDVGSCNGYFSLSTAMRFPAAQVLGVEGSVGVGNGTLGTLTRSAAKLVATDAIRTHLRWVNKLGLSNCLLAPEVWDLDRIDALITGGFQADAMLSLSVVHHIDGICQAAYERRGLSSVDGSLTLLARLMQLAAVHVLELPDRPWLEHLHKRYRSPEAIIRAVAAHAGEEWTLRQIYRNEWLGMRELWYIERPSPGDAQRRASLREAFKILLPGDEAAMDAMDDTDDADLLILQQRQREQRLQRRSLGAPDAGEAGEAEEEPEPKLPCNAAFAQQCLCGRWRNAYGNLIEVSGEPPSLQCLYLAKGSDGAEGARTGDMRTIVWDGVRWCLETSAGHFRLQSVSGRLSWRSRANGFVSEWDRAE